MLRDIRHAVRAFVKSPGFSAIAVLSIAFGTGANVAVFSAADAILLRPLPVERPSELVTIGTHVPSGLAMITVAAHPDYIDIRQRAQSFSGIVAFTSRRVGFSATPNAAPRIKFASIVSDNFFNVLGVEPHLGRDFRLDENQVAGRDAVAVLGYGMCRQEFAADTDVIGRTVRIAGIDFTVIGVAPERFT